jgi:hypothetical protein
MRERNSVAHRLLAFKCGVTSWSAKLPLSIVTDFDELAVYDYRIKPDQKDQADKARIKLLHLPADALLSRFTLRVCL